MIPDWEIILMSCIKIVPCFRTPSTGVMEDQQLPSQDTLEHEFKMT